MAAASLQQQSTPTTAAYDAPPQLHQQQQQQQATQPPAQWQADRICAAAGAGRTAELEAALLAAAASGADAAHAANCRDSQRHLTPLHWACLGGTSNANADDRSACAALLLARGARPNARDVNGCSPLHHSACYNSLAVCQQLIAKRATRLDLRNRWGRTALMLAAWGEADRSDVARALLAAGAGLDVRDSRGRTALMWAALAGKQELLELLLAAGADWRRRNLEGRTAEQLAEREGHAGSARVLAAAAAAAASAAALAEARLKSPPPVSLESPGDAPKAAAAAADAATTT